MSRRLLAPAPWWWGGCLASASGSGSGPGQCSALRQDLASLVFKHFLKPQKKIKMLVKTMTSFLAVQCVHSRVCHRNFWGWLNAVFNKVDYDRIKDVGPDRAASEWLLRCGASVRYKGFDKWQKDYNHLPTGPLEKFKIERIDATESCIMFKGFDYLGIVS
ncbi:hypothetical protein chiPu_0005795 [Chiloscyllium punctatum]|uniref:Uncharacterized protein n=1 Tax=Chiloscyllium punctatum TaxID=137246 RepID=A0A401SAD9_CHIPU|nr:hypothetical protein [Chiloscyllium punctatum]